MRTAVFLLLLWSLLLPLCWGLHLSLCETKMEYLEFTKPDNDCAGEDMKEFVERVAKNCSEIYMGNGSWSTSNKTAECILSTTSKEDCNPFGEKGLFKHALEYVCEFYKEKLRNESILQKWKKFPDLKECRNFHLKCQYTFDKTRDYTDDICGRGFNELNPTECPNNDKLIQEVYEECMDQIERPKIDRKRECVMNAIVDGCQHDSLEVMISACTQLTPANTTTCSSKMTECFKKLGQYIPTTTTTLPTTVVTSAPTTPPTTAPNITATIQESTTTATAPEPTTSDTTPSTTSFDPTTTANDTTTTEVSTTTESTTPTTTPSSTTTEPTTVTTVPTTVETTTKTPMPDTTTTSSTTRSTSTTTTTEDTRIYTKKPEVEDGLDAVRRKKALEAKNEGKKDEEGGTNLTALWVCLGLGVAVLVGVGVVVFFVVRRKLKKKKEEAGKAGKKAVPATKNPFAPSKRPPGPRPTPSVMESGTTEGFRNDGVLTVDVAIWKNDKMEHATGDDEGKLIENVEDVIFDATMNRIVAIGSEREKILTEEALDFTVGAPAKEGKKSEVKSVAKPDAGP